MIRHVRMGREVSKVSKSFPMLSLSATIQPITRTVLRVRLTVTPEFEWNDKLHGLTSDPWWIWVEDAENNHMYHSEYFLLQRKQVWKTRLENTFGNWEYELAFCSCLSANFSLTVAPSSEELWVRREV